MRTYLFQRILALLLVSCAPGVFALKVEYLPAAAQAYAPAAGEARPGREVASGRAFVRFEAGVSSAAAANALSAAGFKLVKYGYAGGWSLAGLPEGLSVSAALPVLRSLPGAAASEPSGVYHATKVPYDQYRVEQYGLTKTDAFRAWDFETGFSSRVTVAVLDTGIDGSHPDLASKLAGGSKFCDPGPSKLTGADDLACVLSDPPTAACVHATRVAGIAAAATDNTYGIAGMSWGARLLSLKVFRDADCTPDCSDKNGPKSCSTDDAAIINAIDYAVTLQNSPGTGRIVLNMSLGEAAVCSPLGPLQDAVTNAMGAGLVLVAAAGNDPASVDSPANCTGVIPVGATDINDNIAGFSARGPAMTTQGVTAPGMNIFTTTPGPAFAFDSGTSFASPLVAGLAALIISTRPALTPSEVGDVIRDSADDLGTAGPDTIYGNGRVNAYKAMLWVVNGNLSAFTPAVQQARAYAFPSPYRPGAGPLSFFVPEEISGASLEITIYTSEGEKIKKISSRTWDGHNEAGRAAASGVYVFFIKTEKGTAKGKFAVLQ